MTSLSGCDHCSDGDDAPDGFLIEISGVKIALASSPEMALELDRTILPFVVRPARPDVTIRSLWTALSAECVGRVIFDSGGLWKLYQQNDSYVFHFTSPVFGPIPYKAAVFDRDFRSGTVFLHRPYFDVAKPINPLQYPLDELLVLSLLSRCGDVAVHACGVVDADGNGYLFPGPSGAGKTTMARLWQRMPGAVVLNDERIIVRYWGGRFWMYGTPWHGEAEFAVAARAPLARVFFLHHDSGKTVRSVSGMEAALLLFSCIFPAFHDRQSLELTMQTLDRIVSAVPIAELGVVPDAEMVPYILSAPLAGMV